MKRSEFDDMRPYYDEEIPDAMQRIAQSEIFPVLSGFVYPERTLDDVRTLLCGFKTVCEFQTNTMKRFNERIVETSISNLSLSGTEILSPFESYLYVSNHRDIVLDSSLFEYAIDEKGFDTTEITFGANLMMNNLVIDIGKSNKMFKVERPGNSIKEFYASSKHLSDYLWHTIGEKRQSIWIAQRNGRTKDGVDKTDVGLIKMFAMSNRRDELLALTRLHIVPMSIAYEWEPCDELKAIELLKSRSTKYVKAPGEDMNSILTGMRQYKGRVHIQLCPPITADDLCRLPDTDNMGDFHKAVARLIDHRIHNGYMLMPTNYVAFDILHGSHRFSENYSDDLKRRFIERLDALRRFEGIDVEALREIFLGIYAGPVNSKFII